MNPDPQNLLNLKAVLWFVLVMSIVITIGLFAPPYVEEWLRFLRFDWTVDSMWRDIASDFSRGLVSFGLLLTLWVAAALLWNRNSEYAAICIWMAVLFFGREVFKTAAIYHYCPGLLEGERQSTRWQTLAGYRDDRLWDTAFWVYYVILFGFMWLTHSLSERTKARAPQPA